MAGKERLIDRVKAAAPPPAPAADAEQVTKRQDGDVLEARSTSRTIRTVEDLLRHIEADLDRYEVAASEATKWESASVDRSTGQPVVTELFRVFVRLKPRGGPTTREIVDGLIAAAASSLRLPKRGGYGRKQSGLWSVLVMSDLHFGGRSWRHTTGSDYDLSIAAELVGKTASRLIDRSAASCRRTIVLAGDTLHFDTISGTTTGGTYIDRDSRLQKTIEMAVAAIAGVVEQSAETLPTEVVFVPGNHDTAMAWALQKIFAERYRDDKRVSVNTEFTSRKYLTHGGNLIGITHGDKARKKLAGVMAIEAAAQWSQCRHREWHVGHLHHQAAEVGTIDSVIVRTAPTIVPPDSWHVEMGFVGAERAMQGFVYSQRGGLHEMHMEYVGGAK
jgi:UDP-2,3-diacylglucosamine pyrophosphatase LpxH